MNPRYFYTFLLAIILLSTAQAASVSVTNKTGKLLKLHCASGSDNIGTKILKNGESMSWSFGYNIFTLFYCDASQDGIKKHWDVFDYELVNNYSKKRKLSWVVTRFGKKLITKIV
ncbi:hypothetical protein RhiirA5_419397 [Rhizophagus irregularis]|uniref:Uncharacterized protein n=3 Tax=Rhizophagus irregularis TaxID=588596 RepID=A0A2I1EWN7_9GLOM|nr:hypothetical protein RirG_267270 [Rhizophagus irregularis DAOM 197198w]PKC06571.1 hypothetical protein RhiirA5_419397 [Rhizophagus irregularis]PKY26536.1 hypothetical protein RhiirB3_441892 [Rhizophagus irregularis]CAB4392996.1 unnamed protein product [Rhizophagus irregularis]CAB5328342.1 unnamed protein product [Rhizophagus irregularis]